MPGWTRDRPRGWTPATLDQARGAGDDNALPLRHLASLLVIYGHSYDLSRPASGGGDLVAAWLPGFKAGSLAVYLFFAISGYLVMLSVLRNPGFFRYLRNRVLRILPGYWLQLLVCVALLGGVFTQLPLPEYVRHPGTLDYLGANWLPISFDWDLPGVFADNPFPNVVNGSLWSLGLEMRWYSYLGLLLALGLARRRAAFTVVAVAFLAFAAWEWWLGRPDALQYRALSVVFVSSALMAHWRQWLPLSHPIMAAFVLASIAALGSSAFGPMATAAVVYATFWVIYALPPLGWPADRDYSYGLFLYGFPAQQALLALWPQLAPMALFGSAAVLALVFAVLSWHLVEAPALRWKAGRAAPDLTRPGRPEPGTSDRRTDPPSPAPPDPP